MGWNESVRGGTSPVEVEQVHFEVERVRLSWNESNWWNKSDCDGTGPGGVEKSGWGGTSPVVWNESKWWNKSDCDGTGPVKWKSPVGVERVRLFGTNLIGGVNPIVMERVRLKWNKSVGL